MIDDINLLLMEDWYKVGHIKMYPKGTTRVYSYCCGRGSRLEGVDKIVFFGLQYFIKKYLLKPITQANKDEFLEYVEFSLGKKAINQNLIDDIDELIKLGYLPLRIRAIPEGKRVGLQIPLFTITNTQDRFFWLTNFVESLLMKVFYPTTCATIAYRNRVLINDFAKETCDNDFHTPYQLHDFSYRGLTSEESGWLAGAAHLLSSDGTDTIAGVRMLNNYYHEKVGKSVDASEHSVVELYGSDNELEYIKSSLRACPEGIVSLVADTYNYWRFIDEYIPSLYKEILGRSGTVVLRPDSSKKTPYEVICGDTSEIYDYHRNAGSIRILDKHFGHTVNSKGYKVLNPKIGLIYGDAISHEMANKILSGLKNMGYASSNIVFGIGSWTYQGNLTRDTFNFAIKATHGVVNGESINTYKSPIDDSKKNSLKGLLAVYQKDPILEPGEYFVVSEATEHQEANSELKTVFEDGRLLVDWKTPDVRRNLWK
jgi:nicotinamide phosphoribosyltransferase